MSCAICGLSSILTRVGASEKLFCPAHLITADRPTPPFPTLKALCYEVLARVLPVPLASLRHTDCVANSSQEFERSFQRSPRPKHICGAEDGINHPCQNILLPFTRILKKRLHMGGSYDFYCSVNCAQVDCMGGSIATLVKKAKTEACRPRATWRRRDPY